MPTGCLPLLSGTLGVAASKLIEAAAHCSAKAFDTFNHGLPHIADPAIQGIALWLISPVTLQQIAHSSPHPSCLLPRELLRRGKMTKMKTSHPENLTPPVSGAEGLSRASHHADHRVFHHTNIYELRYSLGARLGFHKNSQRCAGCGRNPFFSPGWFSQEFPDL